MLRTRYHWQAMGWAGSSKAGAESLKSRRLVAKAEGLGMPLLVRGEYEDWGHCLELRFEAPAAFWAEGDH